MECKENGEVYSITGVLHAEKNGLWFWGMTEMRMKEDVQGWRSCGSRRLNGDEVSEITRTGELNELVCSGDDIVLFNIIGFCKAQVITDHKCHKNKAQIPLRLLPRNFPERFGEVGVLEFVLNRTAMTTMKVTWHAPAVEGGWGNSW